MERKFLWCIKWRRYITSARTHKKHVFETPKYVIDFLTGKIKLDDSEASFIEGLICFTSDKEYKDFGCDYPEAIARQVEKWARKLK